MAARTNEGHMDFQYNNETGPIGADSPFAAYANTKQPWQTDSMAKKRTSQTKINVERPGPLTRASLGPFDSFDSPIKSQSAPIRFRPPRDDQSFHFSPSSPNRLPRVEKDSFITPRKAQPDVPSSEPETSPDNNADSEATPDSSARPISRGKAENSGPLRVFKGVHGSPGRGEIARGSNSSVLRHRVSKNKRLKADPSRWLRTRRDSSASDDFDSDSPQNCYTRSVKSSSRSAATASGPVASFIGFIDAHPSLPHTLSFYAQLFLNVFLVLFFIYIIYSFWATIRADVDKKSEEAAADILAEMAACTKSYRENDCGLDKRVPALESICANWERCMKRDPRSVGRARVSAHTFAEIFNSFIEPISVKAMVSQLLSALQAHPIPLRVLELIR